jgi:hypothetical protein
MLGSGWALQAWIHPGRSFSSPATKTCGAIIKAATLAHASLAGLGGEGRTSLSSLGAPNSARAGVTRHKHNEPTIAVANLMDTGPCKSLLACISTDLSMIFCNEFWMLPWTSAILTNRQKGARLITGPPGLPISVAGSWSVPARCAHALAANAALHSTRALCPSCGRLCRDARRLRDATWLRFRGALRPCYVRPLPW